MIPINGNLHLLITTLWTLKSTLPTVYYIILDITLKSKSFFPHVTEETEAWKS